MSSLSLRTRHVLSIEQFDRARMEALFELATALERLVESGRALKYAEGRVLATAFYEPSTRTSCSFQAAMLRLGGGFVAVTPATSSAAKGETVADTVRCLESYADAVVVRHPEKGAVAEAAAAATRAVVLNGGDGVGEHPSQALLDVFAIRRECGRVGGLTVALLGDLKHGRTTHSLARALARFPGVTLRYLAPPGLEMPADVVAAVDAGAAPVRVLPQDAAVPDAPCLRVRQSAPHASLCAGSLTGVDVLYVTRVQRERFPSQEAHDAAMAAAGGAYVVSPATLAAAGGDEGHGRPVVLHPLPRVGELCASLDADERRAAYFRQMRHGLHVRMALLCEAFLSQQQRARILADAAALDSE